MLVAATVIVVVVGYMVRTVVVSLGHSGTVVDDQKDS